MARWTTQAGWVTDQNMSLLSFEDRNRKGEVDPINVQFLYVLYITKLVSRMTAEIILHQHKFNFFGQQNLTVLHLS